jgi:hypothetical protein
MLVEIKREISENSKKLIENVNDMETFNSVRYCNDITEILSKVSTLSSYAKPKNFDISYISEVTTYMMYIAGMLENDKNGTWYELVPQLKAITYMFVSTMNTIEFDFQKKRFSINLKEFKIGNIKLPGI